MSIAATIYASAADPWWWLSFADGELPAGSQFLGVAIVQAPEFLLACMATHNLKINPGGEVQGFDIPPSLVIPEVYCNRLLTRAEAEELDREIGKQVVVN